MRYPAGFLAVAELLKCISAALKDNVSRRLTENSLFENYGKLCLTIDEVINEVSFASVCAMLLDRFCIGCWARHSHHACRALLMSQTETPYRKGSTDDALSEEFSLSMVPCHCTQADLACMLCQMDVDEAHKPLLLLYILSAPPQFTKAGMQPKYD